VWFPGARNVAITLIWWGDWCKRLVTTVTSASVLNLE
jgi:hypothetical protein